MYAGSLSKQNVVFKRNFLFKFKKIGFCFLIFTVLCWFCHTATQIGHNYIYIPSLLSILPLPPPHPSRAPDWAPCGRQTVGQMEKGSSKYIHYRV